MKPPITARTGLGYPKPITYLFMGLCSLLLGSSLCHAAKGLEGAAVIRVVLRELRNDPGISIQTLKVYTINGIVKLQGTVNNILSKKRAEEVARSVKGVRSVINTIELEAEFRSDPDILRDIRRTLLNHPVIELYEIQAQVVNGIVTLEGMVDSWQEARLCIYAVEGIRGVKEVQNKIKVYPKMNRPDHEIKTEIKGRLYWDVWMDETLVDVKVNQGKVMLEGIVGSAAERHRAYEDAWVTSVSSVDISKIEIDWRRYDEIRRTLEYALESDDKIWRTLKEAFIYDPRILCPSIMAGSYCQDAWAA
ncbi:MAG: BON domain-containing protein [Deltaproteobacteria bacterium]|nr:BON domain-containing protein [Deltaproteobacteria bacterium]